MKHTTQGLGFENVSDILFELSVSHPVDKLPDMSFDRLFRLSTIAIAHLVAP